MNTCIRGCVRPCRCEACAVSDEPQHEPQPSPAEEGLLCRKDGNRLYKWLGSVLDDTLRLDTRIPVDYGWEKESSHQKVTGSPALIRLDVAALTDHRTNGQPEGEAHPPIDIPGEVMMWARMFTEEQDITSPVDTMARAVDVLTAWWETLLTQLWVDEFYMRMHDIRQLLDLAHNVERPKPMGQCFTCEASLYAQPGCTDIRCHKCGRRYNGLDIVKLEVQRRREATA